MNIKNKENKNSKNIIKNLVNNGYFLTWAFVGLLYNITTLDNPDRNTLLAIIGLIPFAISAIAYTFGIIEQK